MTVITEINGANTGDIIGFFSGTLTLTNFTSDQFTLTKNGRTVTVTGSGFTYNDSGLTGGTITGVSMDGIQTWSNLSVSAAAAWNAVAVGDTAAFTSLFFGGDDSFNLNGPLTNASGGSGYGGNDTYNVSAKTGLLSLDGGAGTDTVNLNAGFGIAFLPGSVSNSPTLNFTNIETVNLAAGSDYYFIPSALPSGTTMTVDGSHLGAGNKLVFAAGSSSSFPNIVGNLILLGGAGDDYLSGGVGNDTFNGGAGNDTASFLRASSGVTVSLAISGPQAIGGGMGTDTLVGIENLVGSNNSNDTLTGDDGDNVFDGAQGLDIFYGGGGNDTVAFTLTGNSGNSIYASLAANIGGTFNSIENLIGTKNADTLEGNSGNNVLDGADGLDTVSFAHATSGVTVDFTKASQQATGAGTGTDTLISIEKVIGSSFDDTFIATAVNAEASSNLTYKYSAAGYFQGGGGNDTLDWSNLPGSITFATTDIAHVIGTAYNDQLVGNLDNLVLDGGGGNDILAGGPSSVSTGGTTTLLGGDGNDSITLNALDASDRIDGGAGTDSLLVNGYTGTSIVFGATTMTGIENLTLSAGTYNIKTADATVAAGAVMNVTVAYGNGSAVFDGSAETDGSFVMSTNSSNVTLIGGAGNDIFKYSGGYYDHIDGGAGFDYLDLSGSVSGGIDLEYNDPSMYLSVENIEGVIGTDGYDQLGAASSGSVLLGKGGNDRLISRSGNDYLDGGDGEDVADYSLATSSVRVNLSRSGAQDTGAGGIDTLINVEDLVGSSYGDVLTGDAGNNQLSGGDGNDVLEGGDGDDNLSGGNGFDYASYAGASSGVSVSLALIDTLGYARQNTIGAGTDTLVGIEGLIGSAFDDVLTGNSANNNFQGGAGNNLIDGGAGDDTASYAQSFSNYTVRRNADGSITVSGNGLQDTLRNIEHLNFAGQTRKIGSATNDFNGDGKSDILWQNASSHAYTEWLMNGGAVSSSIDLGTVASWTVVGSGDFNGDGKADILWRHTSGATEIDGIGPSGWTNMGNPGSLDASWSVAAVGDFNGDGEADILWQNTSHSYSKWTMDGGTALSKQDMSAVSSAWSIAGAGDFDGDGKAEVLWRHVNGTIEIDSLAGTGWGSIGNPGTVDANWSVAAIGDFDGDGKSDILWQNTLTHTYTEWVMNGGAIAATQDLGVVSSAWSVVSSGDFNGDGKTEILWHHASGAVEVDGIGAYGWTNLGNPDSLDSNWSPIESAPRRKLDADFNGDGKSDVLWQAPDHSYLEWQMDGATVSSSLALGAVPSWSVVATGDFNGDGKADVLWHHVNGTVEIDSLGASGWTNLGNPGSVDANWSAAAVGDFNGDGKTDVLWQTPDHSYTEWLMDGGTVSSSLSMGPVPSWSIVGSGDFNGDGKADILWHHVNGTVEIDSLGATGWSSLGTSGNIDSAWTVAAIGDFNGDGKADILWQAPDHSYSEWLMDGATIASQLDLGPVPSWTVAGSGDFNGDGKAEILWHHVNGTVEIDGIGASGWVNLGSPGNLDSSWTVASQTTVLAGH